MKNRVALTLAGLLIWGGTWAEKYHGTLLYDLQGPVAKVKINTSNPVVRLYDSASFLENGQGKNEVMTYDDEGYPIGYGINMRGKNYSLSVKYDADKRPEQLDLIAPMKGGDSLAVKNLYEGDRVAETTYIVDGKTEIKCLYSDEKRDAHGNWTERRVSETVKDRDPSKSATRSYTETRKIEYFDAEH
ncbi:MAG: hypothetical protein HDS70_02385 [Bacteroidales bacterium]|nr:hypothetical protein [Bacteroidales bacterium]